MLNWLKRKKKNHRKAGNYKDEECSLCGKRGEKKFWVIWNEDCEEFETVSFFLCYSGCLKRFVAGLAKVSTILCRENGE